jgi:hypothetical protein
MAKSHNLEWHPGIFGPMPLCLFFNTRTMHIKSIVHNSIAMYDFLKHYIYPAGIRARVLCSRGEWDVDYATLLHIGIYLYFICNGHSPVFTTGVRLQG